MNRQELKALIHKNVDRLEYKYVGCCNGDSDGCGGLLVLKYPAKLDAAERRDFDAWIQSWMPEMLEDGSIPHHFVLYPNDPDEQDVWNDPDYSDVDHYPRKTAHV